MGCSCDMVRARWPPTNRRRMRARSAGFGRGGPRITELLTVYPTMPVTVFCGMVRQVRGQVNRGHRASRSSHSPWDAVATSPGHLCRADCSHHGSIVTIAHRRKVVPAGCGYPERSCISGPSTATHERDLSTSTPYPHAGAGSAPACCSTSWTECRSGSLRPTCSGPAEVAAGNRRVVVLTVGEDPQPEHCGSPNRVESPIRYTSDPAPNCLQRESLRTVSEYRISGHRAQGTWM